jgi:hypothetical protein
MHMNQLEERVARMEKSLRVYHILFALLIIITGTTLLMSHTSRTANVPDVIQAKSFQVVDNYGNVLVKLGMEKSNGSISTYQPDGKELVSLFTSDGGAGAVNTFDKYGNVIFKLTNTIGGGGYMALYNADVKEVAEFGTTTNSTGYFRINDKYGDKIAWLTYTEGGGGYFSLSNAGKETIRLSTPGAGGRIGVYNSSNTRIGFVGTMDNGDGNITIYNNYGTRSGGVPN